MGTGVGLRSCCTMMPMRRGWSLVLSVIILFVVVAEGTNEGTSAEMDTNALEEMQAVHTALAKLGANASPEAKVKVRQNALRKEKSTKEKLHKVKESNVKLREKVTKHGNCRRRSYCNAYKSTPSTPKKPLCGELQVAKTVCKDMPPPDWRFEKKCRKAILKPKPHALIKTALKQLRNVNELVWKERERGHKIQSKEQSSKIAEKTIKEVKQKGSHAKQNCEEGITKEKAKKVRESKRKEASGKVNEKRSKAEKATKGKEKAKKSSKEKKRKREKLTKRNKEAKQKTKMKTKTKRKRKREKTLTRKRKKKKKKKKKKPEKKKKKKKKKKKS